MADPKPNAADNLPSRDRLQNEGPLGKLLAFVLDRIDDADEGAARERVENLRRQHPDWTREQYVSALIQRKVQQTAAIGAATAGSGLIPGLGTVAALTVGAVADIGATMRLQTELVIEIAAVYDRRMTDEEKRHAVLLISGLVMGGTRLASRGGARLTLALTERYTQRWLARALPFAGVAAAAGANALSTYLIGRRAVAYFSLGPEAVGSWAESLRALSGVDERRLAGWVADATRRTAASGRQRWAALASGTRERIGASARRVRGLLPGRKQPALPPPAALPEAAAPNPAAPDGVVPDPAAVASDANAVGAVTAGAVTPDRATADQPSSTGTTTRE